MQTTKFATVDEYIDSFPEGTQNLLQQLRYILKQAAPQAQEVISYNMPALKINKTIVYYAGYKSHIGFYPMPDAIKVFAAELSSYKLAKGTVHFSLKDQLNQDLITRMVQFNILKDKQHAIKKSKSA